jgi:hypothetical protein
MCRERIPSTTRYSFQKATVRSQPPANLALRPCRPGSLAARRSPGLQPAGAPSARRGTPSIRGGETGLSPGPAAAGPGSSDSEPAGFEPDSVGASATHCGLTARGKSPPRLFPRHGNLRFSRAFRVRHVIRGVRQVGCPPARKTGRSRARSEAPRVESHRGDSPRSSDWHAVCSKVSVPNGIRRQGGLRGGILEGLHDFTRRSIHEED